VVAVTAIALLVVGGVLLWPHSPAQSSDDVESVKQEPTRAQQGGGPGRAVVASGPQLSDANGNGVAAPDAIVTLGWGAGELQVGRSRPQEANPEAPMAFAVDPQGTTWVLDQVNGRLLKLGRDGKPAGTVPLSLQAAQDIAIAKDGTVLVMDRLVDKAVALVGPDGKQRGELKLEGRGLTEGGASTGLFTQGNSVYVEREHGDLVRIG
jgi:hypothetical protein